MTAAWAADTDAPQVLQSVERDQVIQQVIRSSDEVSRLDQVALNASNVVSATGTDLRSISQRSAGTQSGVNEIVAGSLDALSAISQSATNVTNLIAGATISAVNQQFADGALQSIANGVTVSTSEGTIAQAGVNAANLIFSEESIGIGTQDFAEHATQRIVNTVTFTGSGRGGHVEQSGVNLGNVLVADRVDQVIRSFAGDQLVTNSVLVPDGGLPDSVAQSGLNIANYLEATEVGVVDQVSTGRQVVVNRVAVGTLDDYQPLPQGLAGVTQSSASFVNVFVARAPSSTDADTVLALRQEANFPQSVVAGPGTNTQVGNAMSITR